MKETLTYQTISLKMPLVFWKVFKLEKYHKIMVLWLVLNPISYYLLVIVICVHHKN